MFSSLLSATLILAMPWLIPFTKPFETVAIFSSSDVQTSG